MLVLLGVEGEEIVILNREILRIDNIEYRSTEFETSNSVQNTNESGKKNGF